MFGIQSNVTILFNAYYYMIPETLTIRYEYCSYIF